MRNMLLWLSFCIALAVPASAQTFLREGVDFVIDFEKVDFMDSEGLETLLWIKRKCEDRFGQIKLVKLDENCRKILEITRLEHRFECHAELAAALKTMR